MARYVERSGESIEEAVIILDAKDSFEGVRAEYKYLERRFGKTGKDWELKRQTPVDEGDKKYDKMDLKFPDGTKKTIYFDITSFFGRGNVMEELRSVFESVKE